MFLSPETLTELIALGAPPEKLARILHMIEQDALSVAPRRSSGAERQARYEARKRQKASESVSEASETSETSERPSLPPSPQTPQPPTHPRRDISSRGGAGAREADFDAFWAAYPDKTGKKAARKAWGAAKDRPTLDEVLAALDRYRRAKPPDRAWCHASTWLNQGRWDDQPAEVIPLQPRSAPRNDRPDRFTAKQDNYASAIAGAEWADQVLADRRAF